MLTFKRFMGMRTYSEELQRDLRELEGTIQQIIGRLDDITRGRYVFIEDVKHGDVAETGAQTPTLSANLPAKAAATASATFLPVVINGTKGWIAVWQ